MLSRGIVKLQLEQFCRTLSQQAGGEEASWFILGTEHAHMSGYHNLAADRAEVQMQLKHPALRLLAHELPHTYMNI